MTPPATRNFSEIGYDGTARKEVCQEDVLSDDVLSEAGIVGVIPTRSGKGNICTLNGGPAEQFRATLAADVIAVRGISGVEYNPANPAPIKPAHSV